MRREWLNAQDVENLSLSDSVEAGIGGGVILLSNGDAVSWDYHEQKPKP